MFPLFLLSEDWNLASMEIETFLADRQVLYEQGNGFKCTVWSELKINSLIELPYQATFVAGVLDQGLKF